MVVVNFNRIGFETELSNIQEQLETLRELLQCFETITGKREIIELAELNKLIKAKSNYPNVVMSAQLLGIDYEFSYISQNANKYDLSHFYISDDKTIVEIKETTLNELKEKYTTYLDKDKEQMFHQLQKAIKILNEMPTAIHKCINQDYLGKFNVNINALHNFGRI